LQQRRRMIERDHAQCPEPRSASEIPPRVCSASAAMCAARLRKSHVMCDVLPAVLALGRSTVVWFAVTAGSPVHQPSDQP
jgi:hypothetical protein